MSCFCGIKFCYHCNSDITEIGYDHFYGENKTCNLFDQEALAEWNRLQGGGQAHNEFRRDMQAGRYGNAGFVVDSFCKCPRCRQNNALREDGNNSLKCWACNTNFCACCKGLVAKGHYGKGRPCPMHGPKR
jgi:E3 ubiquitin-protein ligase RNF14